MKEYIDREKFLKQFNVLYNVLDNLERMLYSDALVKLIDIPVADVIEREKIDKAIEEMGKLASQPISLDQKDAIDMCIKIIKRNIER